MTDLKNQIAKPGKFAGNSRGNKKGKQNYVSNKNAYFSLTDK